MSIYIYRNTTVEHLFKGKEYVFSGYGDISIPSISYNTIVWFYIPTLLANKTELLEEIKSYNNRLDFILNNAQCKNFIVFTLTNKFIFNYSETDLEIKNEIEEFNKKLYSIGANNPLIKFINIDEFLNAQIPAEILDWKYFYISDMVISPKMAKPFGIWVNNKFSTLQKRNKKCIVVDLDNTLWGGVLGEDGIDGIQLGDTYPGRAFKHFQEHLLEASKNGVILAVCSKNNEADVFEAWEKHPSMVLKREHFSAIKINWQNKAINIAEIAEEINIGLDSVVFLDDNPAERTMVSQNLPEVVVPEFPEQPYNLYNFFKQVYSNYFQIYSLTKEDKNKTEQYLQNTQRKIHQQNFINIDEYLSSLQMQLVVRYADELTITRIAQMTQKTNQFNLTTKRLSESDIQNFLNNKHWVISLAVKDKFGDNGITVAAIIEFKDTTAHIHSFLLSCRILGRGIEKAFVFFLLNKLLDSGVKEVTAEYIPTNKNIQTANFYETVGFNLKETSTDGIKKYHQQLNSAYNIPSYYNFEIVTTQ